MWTHTLDGRAMSLSEIIAATGIAPLRIKRVCASPNPPTTLAELREAVRLYLSQPVKRRMAGSMYVWNNSALSPSRKRTMATGTE